MALRDLSFKENVYFVDDFLSGRSEAHQLHRLVLVISRNAIIVDVWVLVLQSEYLSEVHSFDNNNYLHDRLEGSFFVDFLFGFFYYVCR